MDSMYGVIRSLHMYIDTVWTVVVKYDFFKFKIATKLTSGDIAKGQWDTEIEPPLFSCSCFILLLFKLFLVRVALVGHAGAKNRGHVHLGGGVTD